MKTIIQPLIASMIIIIATSCESSCYKCEIDTASTSRIIATSAESICDNAANNKQISMAKKDCQEAGGKWKKE
ncbi:hypothetical protein [Flammeovirga sp. SJP92]|uniref:hypothetical protein n=1 Tax=Flammeovirga sp. SJP92 TaxID=1775430 RepID=UPI000787A029|nr:hypothetical protein [Flammeovirga sp. SJP92]KXX67916.1 hypothetical protein AVL50_23960 [Flammeovirga sp. SJP92]